MQLLIAPDNCAPLQHGRIAEKGNVRHTAVVQDDFGWGQDAQLRIMYLPDLTKLVEIS